MNVIITFNFAGHTESMGLLPGKWNILKLYVSIDFSWKLKYTSLNSTGKKQFSLNIRLFTFLQSWRFKPYKYLYKKYNLKRLKQEECFFSYSCLPLLFPFPFFAMQPYRMLPQSSKKKLSLVIELSYLSKVLLFCLSIFASFLSIFPRSGFEHS